MNASRPGEALLYRYYKQRSVLDTAEVGLNSGEQMTCYAFISRIKFELGDGSQMSGEMAKVLSALQPAQLCVSLAYSLIITISGTNSGREN
jgi:hypothetical protein